jgi:reactive intermediate/imine deaminase
MDKKIIHTSKAPIAVGTYSQAIQVNNTLYLSGQIAIEPQSGILKTDIKEQIHQVFSNLQAVIQAADTNASLDNIVKLNIYLLDMEHFSLLNTIMSQYFNQPYPARAAIAVAELPKNASVEMDGIAVL